MKNKFKPISLIGTLITLPLSLSLISFSADSTYASSRRNQFDVCVREIVKSGIEANAAGQACADALIPRELSKCVSRIRARTPILSTDALQACYQVRRPVDLANCVVDIHRATPIANTTPTSSQETTNTDSKLVLDSCRQSLLPGRYSECVIALSRNGETASPITAMNTCLSAEDFPRDLFPSYTEN